MGEVPTRCYEPAVPEPMIVMLRIYSEQKEVFEATLFSKS